MKINIDLENCKIENKEFADISAKFEQIRDKVFTQDGKTDNLWIELPEESTKQINTIKDKATWIRKHCDVLLVIGVGGSYLGAHAGLEFLTDSVNFPVEFLGTSFDEVPITRFLKKYKGKRVAVNVISKSGTTMEITSAFESIKKAINPHAVIFTGNNPSGNSDFLIPDGVGGRYSVLSAVGLLPFAVAGIDIEQVLHGAKEARDSCDVDAFKYAVARYLLHTKHRRNIEVLTTFRQDVCGLLSWHQQLFCESEGKKGKGLFVSPMFFSRDLHSMGQHLQQGKPVFLETIIKTDDMNVLNFAAFKGTVKAHSDAGVPVIVIETEAHDAATLGYLFYFFEVSCAMSAYLLNVNPFDQPGVEEYKRNMKELLEGK
ncbi:MAG: glucose-6-phosphate isomerase [Christensenellaceae bacterium]|jgi:glucose-6-phosphate isomerase|nr:glucose-6-phosphate isomerase [Christensenellaceae bacterium]